jgi:hypothetical protein
MITFGLEPEPLAFRVRPLVDECFDSWIDRVAFAHEATRSALFRHLGIEPALAGQDLARGRRGLGAAWYAAFDGLVERLAWAVQCEKERISATFLACEASALLPRGLRHYACARCWYEARRAGKPEFIRREWILRASWRCREHGVPLSDMGKAPDEPGGRLSLAQLARLVVLAEDSLAMATPSQKAIRRNSAALAQLARRSEWQRHRAIDLAYRDRFAANVFHFSAARIAMLALAHGRRDAAPRRFETLISQALPERPMPGGGLVDQKLPYRLQDAFKGKPRLHWMAPDLLSLLCAYGTLRVRQDQEAELQAA